jgi:lipopolysaccharide export system protein LptA
MFGEARNTKLVLLTPRCFFDPAGQTVSSPGPLQVNGGEGEFAIEGQGFGFEPGRGSSSNRTAGVLTISNQVQATVRKDFVNVSRDTALASAAQPPPAAGEPVRIYSRRLTLEPAVAVFRDEVRVEDPQGRLTCERLTARFTDPDWRLQTLAAEEQVQLQSGELGGQAGRALYTTASDLLELSGAPSWRMGDRSGSAERVVMDRAQQRVKATGRVVLNLPATALTTGGSWLPEERRRPRAAQTERPGTRSEAQPIQLTADEAEFQPDATRTNVTRGVFLGQVRVRDDRGQLTCDRLSLTALGRDHEVETLVAEQNVQVEQGDSRGSCARAAYVAAAGTVEMTGHPTWRVGEREGESDRLWMDARSQTYRALGQVKMRMPVSALASQSWLRPAPATPEVPAAAPGASLRPTSRVELTCDEFEYVSAPGTNELDRAVYRGHVQVTDPDKASLTCSTLTATLAPGTNQVQTVVAEGEVVMRVQSPSGSREARGDMATFTAAGRAIELTAADRVEILLSDARGDTRATGQRAVYDGARDAFELDGQPLVTSPQGVLSGERVQVDQAHTTLAARGQWSLRIPLKTLGIPADALDRLADPLKEPR